MKTQMNKTMKITPNLWAGLPILEEIFSYVGFPADNLVVWSGSDRLVLLAHSWGWLRVWS